MGVRQPHLKTYTIRSTTDRAQAVESGIVSLVGGVDGCSSKSVNLGSDGPEGWNVRMLVYYEKKPPIGAFPFSANRRDQQRGHAGLCPLEP